MHLRLLVSLVRLFGLIEQRYIERRPAMMLFPRETPGVYENLRKRGLELRHTCDECIN